MVYVPTHCSASYCAIHLAYHGHYEQAQNKNLFACPSAPPDILAITYFSSTNYLRWQCILEAPTRFQPNELIDNSIEGYHCRLGLGPNVISVTDVY